jgi:hypothetical protein
MSNKVAEIQEAFVQDGEAGFVAHLWDTTTKDLRKCKSG